jgi:hypothetical protein
MDTCDTRTNRFRSTTDRIGDIHVRWERSYRLHMRDAGISVIAAYPSDFRIVELPSDYDFLYFRSRSVPFVIAVRAICFAKSGNHSHKLEYEL